MSMTQFLVQLKGIQSTRRLEKAFKTIQMKNLESGLEILEKVKRIQQKQFKFIFLQKLQVEKTNYLVAVRDNLRKAPHISLTSNLRKPEVDIGQLEVKIEKGRLLKKLKIPSRFGFSYDFLYETFKRINLAESADHVQFKLVRVLENIENCIRRQTDQKKKKTFQFLKKQVDTQLQIVNEQLRENYKAYYEQLWSDEVQMRQDQQTTIVEDSASINLLSSVQKIQISDFHTSNSQSIIHLNQKEKLDRNIQVPQEYDKKFDPYQKFANELSACFNNHQIFTHQFFEFLAILFDFFDEFRSKLSYSTIFSLAIALYEEKKLCLIDSRLEPFEKIVFQMIIQFFEGKNSTENVIDPLKLLLLRDTADQIKHAIGTNSMKIELTNLGSNIAQESVPLNQLEELNRLTDIQKTLLTQIDVNIYDDKQLDLLKNQYVQVIQERDAIQSYIALIEQVNNKGQVQIDFEGFDTEFEKINGLSLSMDQIKNFKSKFIFIKSMPFIRMINKNLIFKQLFANESNIRFNRFQVPNQNASLQEFEGFIDLNIKNALAIVLDSISPHMSVKECYSIFHKILPQNVERELNLISRALGRELVDDSLIEMIIDVLKAFKKVEIYKGYTGITYLFQTKDQIHLHPDYIQVLELSQSIENELSLSQISINSLSISFQRVEQILSFEKNNSFDTLMIHLSQSQIVYQFCIENQVENEKLIDKVGDCDFEVSLNDIASFLQANLFFRQLQDQLLGSSISDYQSCLMLLTKSFKLFIENSQPLMGEANYSYLRQKQRQFRLLEHIQTSNIKIQEIIKMINESYSIESTKMIVRSILATGVLKWKNQDDKIIFEIQIDKDGRNINLKQSEIINHSSKFLLIVMANSLEEKEQSQLLFEVSLLSIKICMTVQSLLEYGYHKVDFKTFQVNDQLIVEKLRQENKDLKLELEKWKQTIIKIKKSNFQINFFSYRLIAELVNQFDPSKFIKISDSLFSVCQLFDNTLSRTRLNDYFKDNAFTEQESQMVQKKRISLVCQILEQFLMIVKNRRSQVLSQDQQYILPKRGKILKMFAHSDFEVTEALLMIFCANGLYPMPYQVLFCSPDTQILELELFFIRAFVWPKFYGTKINHPFIIVNFQFIQPQIQLQVAHFLQSTIKNHQFDNFQIYIVSECIDPQKSTLIAEFQDSDLNKDKLADDMYEKIFSDFCPNVSVITSRGSGLGKSLFIRKNSQSNFYIRVPLYGKLDKIELIDYLHQATLNFLPSDIPFFHFDVYPLFNISLNILMFEILFVKSLNSSSEKFFIFPENSIIQIELSQEFHQKKFKPSKMLLNGVRSQVELNWDLNRIEIPQIITEKIQIVCGAVQNIIINFDYDKFMQPSTLLPSENCIEILKKQLFDHIVLPSTPNFYILHSYIDFFENNISLIKQNFLLNQRQITDSFSAKFKDSVQSIISDFSKCSRNLSFVQKIASSQLGSLTQNDEEIQADELRSIDWDKQSLKFEVVYQTFLNKTLFEKLSNVEQSIIDIQQNSELRDLANLTQEEFHEKIFELCLANDKKVHGLNDKIDILKRIVFTSDNFTKLALVFMRIRAKQPVIIMGHTGVGKTALITTLAQILDAHYQSKILHAGITDKQIVQFISEQNEIAMKLPDDKQIIIFLDEVNTNENISGLLKEILIDRHLKGLPLNKNIRFIAACNPYQIQNGMDTKTCGIQHKRMNKDEQKLVYMVKLIPDSIVNFIWDYGSLRKNEERIYIRKMIEQNLRDQIEELNLEKQDFKFLEEQVVKSQEFLREHNGEWSVSLRDVKRFCILLKCFFKEIQPGQQPNNQFTTFQGAYLMALNFNYVFKLSTQNKKTLFEEHVIKRRLLPSKSFLHTDLNFDSVIMEIFDSFIKQMDLPKGIGKNRPLMENVFAIYICIINKIPLFIIGKPGSSKTLAMNLIIQSMRGEFSKSKTFQKHPKIVQEKFQGSLTTTSFAIQQLFNKLIDRSQDDQRQIHMISFDEIGLAELSAHNPLKILHSYLEPLLIPFVGISNWALDAAKMNRGISLQRIDPQQQDLLQSAKAIAECYTGTHKEQFDSFVSRYFNLICSAYEQYMFNQANSFGERENNFHGLRDFYNLIKFLERNFDAEIDFSSNLSLDSSIENFILKGIQRNFGGNNKIFKTMKTFMFSIFRKEFDEKGKLLKSESLIIENIKDKEARNLMIISEHIESSVNFLENIFNSEKIPFCICQGTDFAEDNLERTIGRRIQEIILCIETGQTVILINQEVIYSCFYDMFNQNYQTNYNQTRSCRVSIGDISWKCEVHENFKCILIVDQEEINSMDAPLLNRFEKQNHPNEFKLTTLEENIFSRLSFWVKKLSNKQSFNENNFIQFFSKDMLITMIKQFRLHYSSEEEIEEACKKSLLQVASLCGLYRSSVNCKDGLSEICVDYLNTESIKSLSDRLKCEQKRIFDEPLYKQHEGFNLMVYSQSVFKSENLQLDGFQKEVINLNYVMSQFQLKMKIKQYFRPANLSNLLIISSDINDNQNRTMACRSFINMERTQALTQTGHCEKNVCIIYQIDNNFNLAFNYGSDWNYFTIEDLDGLDQRNQIPIISLLSLTLDGLIKQPSLWTKILQISIEQAISRINYNFRIDQAQSKILQRIQQIKERNQDRKDFSNFLVTFIDGLIQKYEPDLLKIKWWQFEVVCDFQLMKSHSKFTSAAIDYLQNKIVHYLTNLLFLMEENQLVSFFMSNYCNQDIVEFAMTFFRDLMKNDQIQNPNHNQAHALQDFIEELEFPFIRRIHSRIQNLQQIFVNDMNQIISFSNQITFDKFLLEREIEIQVQILKTFSEADHLFELQSYKSQYFNSFVFLLNLDLAKLPKNKSNDQIQFLKSLLQIIHLKDNKKFKRQVSEFKWVY